MQEHRAKLSTIFLIVFTDLVGFGMVIPFLPLWANQFQPSPLQMGLLMASFSAMQFLFAPILGLLSDRYGRRPVLLLSLGGAVCGYLLLASAHSLVLLFASRLVAGAAGGNISTASAVIADITGPENRAKGMGMIGAAFGLGFIFGPAIGGILKHEANWLPGVAAAALSLTALLMTYFLLPETRPAGGVVSERSLVPLKGLAALLHRPLLPLPLVTVFLTIFAFAGFEVTFSLFLSERFQLSDRAIGMTLALAGVLGATVQGGLIGRLARKFGEGRLIATGALLGAIGLGMMPYQMHMAGVLVAIVILAFGMGITNPSLSALTSKLCDPHEVGSVMGVFQSLSSLGRVVGPALAGWAIKAVGPLWLYRSTSVVMLVASIVGLAIVSRLPHRGAPEPRSA